MTKRRPEDIEAYPYSEIDMDMHVEAVTKDLRADNDLMRRTLNRIAKCEPIVGGDAWHMRSWARQALTGRKEGS